MRDSAEFREGMSKSRRDDLVHNTRTHLGLIGIGAPDFLQELGKVKIDSLGEPKVLFPRPGTVRGQEKLFELENNKE